MHACIRASRADDACLNPGQRKQAALENPLYRASGRLKLKAQEIRAIVDDRRSVVMQHVAW
jgi:hypothetical protein